MIRTFAALCTALALISAPASAQSARDLLGAWSGTRIEPNGAETPFSLNLSQGNETKLIGIGSEERCPRCASMQLRVESEWRGTFADGMLRVHKTINALGLSPRHAIVYEGRLSEDGRSIAGVWSAGETGRGTFELTRRAP